MSKSTKRHCTVHDAIVNPIIGCTNQVAKQCDSICTVQAAP